MALVNEHLLKLPDNYFFPLMEKKINTFKVTHPKANLIHLESGDASLPLAPAITAAMHKAVDEMQQTESFKGYAPKQGYDFLIEAILKNDFQPKGIHLDKSEIFITEGIQSSIANIGDLLRHDNSIGITALSYPIYAAANIMYGRAGELLENGTWSNVIYIACPEEKGFIPQIPDRRIDIIYLCNPHMPTGATFHKQELKQWVNYALENDALIMYDATYEAYIRQAELPHSIYEIKGAKKVAIEYRSFSKSAGFTGLRCGYVVIPKEVVASTLTGISVSLNHLWRQHQNIKHNGISYITQRGAEATYSSEGKKETKEQILYYMNNVQTMKKALTDMGFTVHGGEHIPFLWIRTPKGFNSWQFFDKLLYEAHTIVTPGEAFGPSGDNYIRISAFAKEEQCTEAMQRMKELFGTPSMQTYSF